MKYSFVKKVAVFGLAMMMGLGQNVVRADEGLVNDKETATFTSLKGKKVVFVPNAMGTDLTEGWAAIMRKQADRFGYTFEVRDPNWDADAGTRALSEIINTKPDLVVVHNLDVQSYSRLLRQAEQAGIKILQVNMESTQSTASYVGAAWNELGRTEAQLVVNACKGKSGKVAIIAGAPTSAASLYAVNGAYEVFKANPNIQVVSDQAANWDPSRARSIMETVLQQHPDICGVFDMWDSQGVGAGSAIQEANKSDQIFLATNGGGSMPGCENLKKGLLGAIVSYDVPTQGALLNSEIIRLLSETTADTNNARIYTPLRVITKENANARNCWSLTDLK